jgi:uncharacterized OB-fold protein
MNWEPRPVPEVNPESKDYWAGAADEKLLIGECEDCGFQFHIPRAFCPECFSESVSLVETAGTGSVYTYAVVRDMSGWPEEDIPLIVGYVALDEGPCLLTNIRNVDPSNLKIGDRVEVFFIPTERDDVSIPVFEPA